MYVCICKAVTDSQIEQAIDNGAGNLRALQRELGVATQCGQCARCARDMLAARRKPDCEAATINWIPLNRTA